MYNNIVNPKTNRLVKTNSKLGRSILKKYYNMLTGAVGGGGRRRRQENEVTTRFRAWYGDDDYDSDRPSVDAHDNFQELFLANHYFTMAELNLYQEYEYESCCMWDEGVPERGLMIIFNIQIDDSDQDHFVINCYGTIEIIDDESDDVQSWDDVLLFSISYDREDNQWRVRHERDVITEFGFRY